MAGTGETYVIERILGHDIVNDAVTFKIWWKGYLRARATDEPLSSFSSRTLCLMRYITSQPILKEREDMLEYMKSSQGLPNRPGKGSRSRKDSKRPGKAEREAKREAAREEEMKVKRLERAAKMEERIGLKRIAVGYLDLEAEEDNE